MSGSVVRAKRVRMSIRKFDREEAGKLRLEGLSDDQLARVFSITTGGIYQALKGFPRAVKPFGPFLPKELRRHAARLKKTPRPTPPPRIYTPEEILAKKERMRLMRKTSDPDKNVQARLRKELGLLGRSQFTKSIRGISPQV